MNEKSSLAASPGWPGSVSLRSGHDWADWLQHAQGGQPPGRPPPAPVRAEAAWTALVHLARRAGFAVERGNCAAGGITTWPDRRIQITPGTAPAQAITALAHQLGHVLLHAEIARLERSGTVACSGIRKVEADSIAFIVATRLGTGAAAITFPHVSSWAGTDPRARPAATIQAVSDRVLAAAAQVTAGLDAELAPGRTGIRASRTAGAGHSPPSRPAEPPGSDLISIHEAAAKFFRDCLHHSWVPGYLTGRGFAPAVQQRWQAGYALASWDGLTRHLRTAGYPESLIEAAGLARRSRRGTLIDTFRDRAMLPIRSAQGTIVAFIGRAPEHARPDVPKYLNSRRTGLYDKSEVLFGLWEARAALASGARPVIVEGPFDAIAVTTACPGRYAGLAPCGAVLTARQARALDRAANLRTDGVLVAFDPDNAGRRAAARAYHLLTRLTDKTAEVIFPAGQDPAQILRDQGPAALAATLDSRTRPLADLIIDAEVARWSRWLPHPEGQISALRAVAPLIAAMPPAHVARQVARAADRLGLDHPAVTEAVTGALTDVIAGRASSSRRAGAPRTDPHERPAAVIRAGSRDSPHTAQQAVSQAATTAAPRSQRGPAGAAPAGLRAGRIPG
jgi:DNA primase